MPRNTRKRLSKPPREAQAMKAQPQKRWWTLTIKHVQCEFILIHFSFLYVGFLMVNKRTWKCITAKNLLSLFPCLCFGGVNVPMSCDNFEADGNYSALCLSTNEILQSFSVNLVLSAYLSPLIYLNLFQTHGRITKISETSRNLIFVSLSPYVCSILWWWPLRRSKWERRQQAVVSAFILFW